MRSTWHINITENGQPNAFIARGQDSITLESEDGIQQPEPSDYHQIILDDYKLPLPKSQRNFGMRNESNIRVFGMHPFHFDATTVQVSQPTPYIACPNRRDFVKFVSKTPLRSFEQLLVTARSISQVLGISRGSEAILSLV